MVRYCFYKDYRSTYIVATAVYTEVGSHCDGTTEEEDGVQNIESKWDSWVTGQSLVECDSEKVEEG